MSRWVLFFVCLLGAGCVTRDPFTGPAKTLNSPTEEVRVVDGGTSKPADELDAGPSDAGRPDSDSDAGTQESDAGVHNQRLPTDPIVFLANDPRNGHGVGRAEGTDWVSDVSFPAGFVTFGPYTSEIPAGNATATFTLAIDNVAADSLPVVRIEAFETPSRTMLGYRVIQRTDFAAPGQAQDFDVTFEVGAGAVVEFRVWTFGLSFLRHVKTVVQPDRHTLDELWTHHAHFEPRGRTEFSSSAGWDGNTASIVSLDGAWYAFNRQPMNPGPADCTADTLLTVVRRSLNQGKTWSDPVPVAIPTGTDSSDACTITDGGAYFDGETDTWHLLSQCLGKPGTTWNLCHYTRTGSSPMGLFTPDALNPVVRGGQLWSRICAGDGKSCSPSTVDEGTPQILGKHDSVYAVAFHGFDYSALRGVRGVAQTGDFVNWQTEGPGLPADAMFSQRDCNAWGFPWLNGTCAGIGNSNNLRSGGYNYALVEAADVSLACTPGQNWVFGLMRSPTLAASASWELYSHEPYVMNLNVAPQGCALQYMNFTRDRGELFLTFGFYSPTYWFPNETYQLVPEAGPTQLLIQ